MSGPMRIGWLLLLAAVVLAVLVFPGCHRASDRPQTPVKHGSTVGVSIGGLSAPRQAATVAEIRAAAAKDPKLTLLVKDPPADVAAQQADVAEFISARVDAIIIRPIESQPLTDVVARAYQSHIAVVVIDQPLIGDDYTCYLHVDMEQAARAAGGWLAEHLCQQRRIVELKADANSVAGIERHRGFLSALKDPSFRVIDEVDCDGRQDKARQDMAEILARFGQIDAVFAHTDAAACGAYEAAQAAGRAKDIVFVGLGGLPREGAADVAHGRLTASFLLPTGGTEAVAAVEQILRGQSPPKHVELSTKAITRETVPVVAGG